MKAYSKAWLTVNNLLSDLRRDDVVNLVDNHYKQYENTAPAEMLAHRIKEAQKLLDNADRK